MATVAAQVTADGMLVPDFADVRQEFRIAIWNIYGSDVNLNSDSQDGQLIAVFAQAMADANALAEAVYLSFSPSTAQGVGLSSVVKINGLERNVASNSEVTVTVVGVVGTVINAGVVGDNLGLGTRWDLPSPTTIPGAGTIDVTAICETVGATTAAIGTITQILTPTLGWQSVANAAAAIVGDAVETDAELRARQSQSVAISADSPLDAIFAAVANVAGVRRSAIYENDSDVTDANGIPSHSISNVVAGGDPVAIATAIAEKKPPGTGTFGTTTETIVDHKGVSNDIKFFVLTNVTITVEVTIKALTGYVGTTETLIKQAVVGFLNGLAIGEDSYCGRLFAPANLSGAAAVDATALTQAALDVFADTFNVTIVKQSRPSTAPPSVQDVVIAFNEAAVCDSAHITVVVT